MTTTEQKQKQEMVLPSFFYAIASSESRQLISLDELQRIITLDAMTQARTEDYRKNMRISSELAHQTKVMMPGITTSVLMDGRGKERISPLQRPHYFTSSYTYLFSKKVILLSFLG